jgi:hypothetical protein
MAGLLKEGGNILLSGTCSATSPATLADFRPEQGNGISKGPDGYPCNTYALANRDTTSGLILNVVVTGLHDNDTTNAYAYPLYPNDSPIVFQKGEHANELVLIKGWLTTVENATTSSSAYVSGGVIVRRT